jgi:predicted transcriptional regulator
MYKSVLEDFYKLPIENVMKKTGFAILHKDTSVAEVLETLIDFGHIWVTESPNSTRVVGIIARKDFVDMALPPQLVKKSTPGRAETRTLYYEGALATAGDMMSRNIVKVDAKANVADTLRTMSSYFVRQLPVMRNDEIVGEVSMRDLIRNYVEIYKYKKQQGSGEDPCRDNP